LRRDVYFTYPFGKSISINNVSVLVIKKLLRIYCSVYEDSERESMCVYLFTVKRSSAVSLSAAPTLWESYVSSYSSWYWSNTYCDRGRGRVGNESKVKRERDKVIPTVPLLIL
jgi:hypothetical protein